MHRETSAPDIRSAMMQALWCFDPDADSDVFDIDWSGHFHEDLKKYLAEYFRGLIVTSPDEKIKAFGYLPGQVIPPNPLVISCEIYLLTPMHKKTGAA